MYLIIECVCVCAYGEYSACSHLHSNCGGVKVTVAPIGSKYVTVYLYKQYYLFTVNQYTFIYCNYYAVYT